MLSNDCLPLIVIPPPPPTQLEKRSKDLLSASKKADKVYTENCCKAEAARQDWDFSVAKVGL